MGIVVTIVLARVFRVILKAREPTPVHHEAKEVRRAPMAPLTMAFHILSEAIQEGNEGRLQLGDDTAPHARQNRKPLPPVVVKITLLLIPFAGFLACGVVAAYLSTDSKALSNNPARRLYVPASNFVAISKRARRSLCLSSTIGRRVASSSSTQLLTRLSMALVRSLM